MDAKELRQKIDGVIEGRLIPMDLTDEDFRAIRRLIEAVGEWQEITNKLLAPGTSTGHYLKNQTLLYKIRDFGKEEK